MIANFDAIPPREPQRVRLNRTQFDARKTKRIDEHRRECADCEEFLYCNGGGKKQDLMALVAEDIEWIVPGEGWPLAGTHRGHAGLAEVFKKASETLEMTYPKPPEFVAQGDRVLVVGVATGKIKATNKPFKDDWVFDMTVRNGKVTTIREYIDTQAMARASEVDASPRRTDQ